MRPTLDELRAVRDELIQAPALALSGFKVKPCTIFLVAAYHLGGYWKIHRNSAFQEYDTEDKAREYAAKLSPQWVLRHIVKVEIPTGEADAKD